MQQQPQQQQAQYQTTGHIASIDNKRQYKPLRVSIVEASGQVRWFSAWEGVGKSLENGGEGSGPWDITYTEKAYVSATGNQGVNLNVRQAVLNGQVPQPQAQPQVQAQAPVQQAPPPQAPAEETCQHGFSHLAKCTPCIQREVAFKEIEDKNSKSYDTLNDLTNNYEAILQGTYQPSAQPPVDENFIQTEF